MASLDRNLRRDLENAVKKARRVAEAGARQAIEQLAVGHHEPWSALTPEQRKLRNRLRAHGRQLGDRLDERKATQSIERLTGECAYEHWHRLLFARFLAENDLLVEPESGMALSLDECRELARERGVDWLVLASDFAQRMLPQIFRAGDPVLEVALPPENRQELEAILEGLPRDVFVADDSLGWVYQFWQAEQKDAVNARGEKIGADDISAVTQLFTEDYMVWFLLHNTLGAWWAGKQLAARPELATAKSENELRKACALPGYDWTYLRFVREEGGPWRPAAGTYEGWPREAKQLRILDPCMGSGHFLVFALPILVELRRQEEHLSSAEAVDAVLRDNLFGLELDLRCTQLAAFNLAFAAWKVSGHRPLPPMHIACSGLAPAMSKAEWLQLAQRAAQELPAGPRRDLFGSDDDLFSLAAKNGMEALYDLFAQAPTLGSLIDPHRSGANLLQGSYEKLEPIFRAMLGASGSDEMREAAVAAQGMAKAAEILGAKFTLVVTNVPYLSSQKQAPLLWDYISQKFSQSKADLATVFVERTGAFTQPGGSTALVTPLAWTFLGSYKKLRLALLSTRSILILARLGVGAFETISGEVVNCALSVMANRTASDTHSLFALDTSDADLPSGKAASLQQTGRLLRQKGLRSTPDSRFVVDVLSTDVKLLSDYADAYYGQGTGDILRFGAAFWEVPSLGQAWERVQSTVVESTEFGGRSLIVRWEQGRGAMLRLAEELRARLKNIHERGAEAWGKQGVAVSLMGALPACLYDGAIFDTNCAAVVPKNPAHLSAIWAFLSDPQYGASVRKIDQAIKVTNATLLKVPFDLGHWQKVASERYPTGLPNAFSADPTQWTFSGYPVNSESPLHVAVARLVGYRWPRQTGSSFTDCPALSADGLESHADDDGIVCLPSLRGEPPASERVRTLLAHAYGTEWSAAKLNELLASVDFPGKALEDWLRDGFFEQHSALFQNRPFVWHVWDGRRDGFSALVNYHRLTGPSGEGRRTLEKLAHTYLGDWLDRQRADQKAGVEGADGRVAAAEHLKRELERILDGEPPYDIFVRWKPLHLQPIGWEPDVDDGVRLNLRPFMAARPLGARAKTACILRTTPKSVRWDKDRGKEPERSKSDYPWLWAWDEQSADFLGGAKFDGNRWNDLHYSRAVKLAARERAKGGK